MNKKEFERRYALWLKAYKRATTKWDRRIPSLATYLGLPMPKVPANQHGDE